MNNFFSKTLKKCKIRRHKLLKLRLMAIMGITKKLVKTLGQELVQIKQDLELKGYYKIYYDFIDIFFIYQSTLFIINNKNFTSLSIFTFITISIIFPTEPDSMLIKY